MSEVMAFISGGIIGAVPSIATYYMCKLGIFDKFVESRATTISNNIMLMPEIKGGLPEKSSLVESFRKPPTGGSGIHNRKSSSRVQFAKTTSKKGPYKDLWRGEEIQNIHFKVGDTGKVENVTVTTKSGTDTLSFEAFMRGNPGPALSPYCRAVSYSKLV